MLGAKVYYHDSMEDLLRAYYEELKIDAKVLTANRLKFCRQSQLSELQVADIDIQGRPFVLNSRAVKSWRELFAAAVHDNVVLNPASGFRSYLYQKKLIVNQLAKGRTLTDILRGTAIPGFSEHHTGFAIDVCADLSIPEEKFHETETFAWMSANAGRFNFKLSYPEGNVEGMIFEPWHWCFQG
jgi:D-alanyl-D-alanine carboxypeptidase